MKKASNVKPINPNKRKTYKGSDKSLTFYTEVQNFRPVAKLKAFTDIRNK